MSDFQFILLFVLICLTIWGLINYTNRKHSSPHKNRKQRSAPQQKEEVKFVKLWNNEWGILVLNYPRNLSVGDVARLIVESSDGTDKERRGQCICKTPDYGLFRIMSSSEEGGWSESRVETFEGKQEQAMFDADMMTADEVKRHLSSMKRPDKVFLACWLLYKYEDKWKDELKDDDFSAHF